MKKKRVKFLESIAGLADPKPTAELDRKYDGIRREMRMVDRPRSEEAIESVIDNHKAHDRYGQTPIGFTKDWSFRPGDEAVIPAELAAAWEANGTVVIVEEKEKAA